MYPRTGENQMEPRFNIRVADIDQSGIDADFIAPGAQWEGDYMDADSNHADKNMSAYMEQRQGLGDQIQRYVDESHMHATDANPAQDRALMVMEPEVAGTRDLQLAPVQGSAKKFASQAQGFRNDQARADFTLGLVANINQGTIVNARVVAETPTTKIAGTVIAVGDQEFAVVWDDRTASVERKGDYELVIAQ
jgi:hypothetical protein